MMQDSPIQIIRSCCFSRHTNDGRVDNLVGHRVGDGGVTRIRRGVEKIMLMRLEGPRRRALYSPGRYSKGVMELEGIECKVEDGVVAAENFSLNCCPPHLVVTE